MHFSSFTNFLVATLAACSVASPVDLGKRGEITVGFRRADKVGLYLIPHQSLCSELKIPLCIRLKPKNTTKMASTLTTVM